MVTAENFSQTIKNTYRKAMLFGSGRVDSLKGGDDRLGFDFNRFGRLTVYIHEVEEVTLDVGDFNEFETYIFSSNSTIHLGSGRYHIAGRSDDDSHIVRLYLAGKATLDTHKSVKKIEWDGNGIVSAIAMGNKYDSPKPYRLDCGTMSYTLNYTETFTSGHKRPLYCFGDKIGKPVMIYGDAGNGYEMLSDCNSSNNDFIMRIKQEDLKEALTRIFGSRYVAGGILGVWFNPNKVEIRILPVKNYSTGMIARTMYINEKIQDYGRYNLEIDMMDIVDIERFK